MTTPKLLFALIAILFVSVAHSQELLTIRPGIATTVNVAKMDNSTAIVADPEIAQAIVVQNTFVLVGKKVGTTNIIVLDTSTGAELYSATIRVRDENLVMIHNKLKLTSFTVYRCGSPCEYEREVNAKDQPLARGYSNQTSDSTVSTPQPPSPPAVQPPPR